MSLDIGQIKQQTNSAVQYNGELESYLNNMISTIRNIRDLANGSTITTWMQGRLEDYANELDDFKKNLTGCYTTLTTVMQQYANKSEQASENLQTNLSSSQVGEVAGAAGTIISGAGASSAGTTGTSSSSNWRGTEGFGSVEIREGVTKNYIDVQGGIEEIAAKNGNKNIDAATNEFFRLHPELKKNDYVMTNEEGHVTGLMMNGKTVDRKQYNYNKIMDEKGWSKSFNDNEMADIVTIKQTTGLNGENAKYAYYKGQKQYNTYVKEMEKDGMMSEYSGVLDYMTKNNILNSYDPTKDNFRAQIEGHANNPNAYYDYHDGLGNYYDFD